MRTNDRSQCIVIREEKLLMAKHHMDGMSWYCLPGGGVEEGESPEEAALRELEEECLVKGRILMKTSTYPDPMTQGYIHTYYVDIKDQEPVLGEDPELKENPILIDIRWLSLDEICERDRAYLWAAGLLAVKSFSKELESWGDDISYPSYR
ncbi:NUDIX domain-containing protein [Acidaminobacter sp. JC074]|uniref:NUDIX domain-containing protein n=1 Tax=Acidaminobacter sp. JC074 TaxID=2530199 RepID=UPI001F0CFE33|nr:NUDIX domain-containing protein [Acidaminobacter sp. JC074]MCH4886231.1 NUDIX domain-containing protein [Acidaminobacter sp. JC074]